MSEISQSTVQGSEDAAASKGLSNLSEVVAQAVAQALQEQKDISTRQLNEHRHQIQVLHERVTALEEWLENVEEANVEIKADYLLRSGLKSTGQMADNKPQELETITRGAMCGDRAGRPADFQEDLLQEAKGRENPTAGHMQVDGGETSDTESWDDWVAPDRIRKDTEEHKDLARNLKQASDASRRPPPAKSVGTKTKGNEDQGSNGGEERATARSKRTRDLELDNEEDFLRRPEVRLPIPDHLKGILVDDWESVTKNLELVHLPSPHPVNALLDTYYAFELPKRRPASADADLLEEFVDGIRGYFSRALGRILLYTFERQQYYDIRQLWENASAESQWEGKGPADVYGPEHLIRLLISIPELVAQTNMDKQSVARMREETTKLCLWLAKNSGKYFDTPYDKASPEYIETVRGGSS